MLTRIINRDLIVDELCFLNHVGYNTVYGFGINILDLMTAFRNILEVL